jgi:AcrR family transcriptional regulator
MAKQSRPKKPSPRIAAETRSMELLWRVHEQPKRGPKPGFSLDQIIATGIAVADADGLAAVSMRRVAEQLGVGAMSLYTYVPGKAELLELMYDAVLSEVGGPDADGKTWRARLEQLARESWELYQRHPWMLEVPTVRAPLGPNALRAYERTLAAMWAIGLDGHELARTASLLSIFHRGVAQTAKEARGAQHRDGLTETEWWEARVPVLERVLDPARFPLLTSPEMVNAHAPARTDVDYHMAEALDLFEFGLQRVLDGIEMLVERRPPPRRRSR